MSGLQSAEMVERLKDSFDEMVVYKNLKISNFITSFKLPSFMRDSVLSVFRMKRLKLMLMVRRHL